MLSRQSRELQNISEHKVVNNAHIANFVYF